jgi:hypothetical protein
VVYSKAMYTVAATTDLGYMRYEMSLQSAHHHFVNVDIWTVFHAKSVCVCLWSVFIQNCSYQTPLVYLLLPSRRKVNIHFAQLPYCFGVYRILFRYERVPPMWRCIIIRNVCTLIYFARSCWHTKFRTTLIIN